MNVMALAAVLAKLPARLVLWHRLHVAQHDLSRVCTEAVMLFFWNGRPPSLHDSQISANQNEHVATTGNH